jgi:hypothetical protein
MKSDQVFTRGATLRNEVRPALLESGLYRQGHPDNGRPLLISRRRPVVDRRFRHVSA